MQAYQCDRCKKYFNEKNPDGSPYPYIVVGIQGSGDDVQEKKLDLCAKCKDILVKWIKEKEQTNG